MCDTTGGTKFKFRLTKQFVDPFLTSQSNFGIIWWYERVHSFYNGCWKVLCCDLYAINMILMINLWWYERVHSFYHSCWKVLCCDLYIINMILMIDLYKSDDKNDYPCLG